MHAETRKQGSGMYGCCRPMMRHDSRYCGVMFGIMLVLIGAIWLAARTLWFDPVLFWPGTFLAAGFAVIALTLARERKSRTDQAQHRERRNHENAYPKI